MAPSNRPHLIELPVDRPGFNHFIGAWLLTGEVNAIVDVGPANSAAGLLDALDTLGLKRLDWILVTHIHIDHVGGLAAVMEKFPRARAVCHARAIKYLVDPSRLWEGSLKVLGEVAEKAYGRPRAVPAERLTAHQAIDLEGLSVIETPGHAAHHLSFVWGEHLFAGEAGGNYFRIQDQDYLRPATPPRFILEEALASVDRLTALGDREIYYGHLGRGEHSLPLLNRFRKQLLRWHRIVRNEHIAESSEDLEQRSIDALLLDDPELAAFDLMDPATRERERFFIGNSVRGYLGYIHGGA